MQRLRHINDVTIATGANIPWPMSETETTVEFRRGAGLGWNIAFQSGNTVDTQSLLEVPINPNYDVCSLTLFGTVRSLGLKPAQGAPTFEAAHTIGPAEGYLHGWAWGEPRSGVNTPAVLGYPTTKLDAWAPQSVALMGQAVQTVPPYFGYSSSSLNTATPSGRLTPAGFLWAVDPATGTTFAMVAGDRFHIQIPVGHLNTHFLSVSAFKKLWVRLVCTQSVLTAELGYDPIYDFLNIGMTLIASFYEAKHVDPY